MKLVLLLTILAAAAMADDVETEKRLEKGNNEFTASMFYEVARQHPGKSAVMSGFSVMTPLAQMALAADGASHDELLTAIGMPDDEAAIKVFQLINKNLRSVKGVDLRMASRVYIPVGYELDENFQIVSHELFGSEAKNVDFTKSRETAEKINTWVENLTNHRIKNLVSPSSLNSDTRVVLVNAIYFKGQWLKPFKKYLTHDRNFHVSKEKTIKLPTMYRQSKFQYAESAKLNAKLLKMYYGGSEASMLIILPNKIDGLPALEEKLLNDPDLLTRASRDMSYYDVIVYLPRFKIETTTDLRKVLQKINVTKIFDAQEAQLNHMLKREGDLFVSEAKQKALIEVNEEGAEAAAANEFHHQVGSTLNMRPERKPEPKIFRADRPFYFAINVKHTVIFSGVFKDAKGNNNHVKRIKNNHFPDVSRSQIRTEQPISNYNFEYNFELDS